MPDITSARPVSGAPVATAWGAEVHDQLEGLQVGSVSLTWTASAVSATASVTFPRAYTVPPVVIVPGNASNFAGVVAVTTTGFTANGRTSGGASTTQTVAFPWIAIGTPA